MCSLDLKVARIDANHAASERFGEKTSCLTCSAGDIKDIPRTPGINVPPHAYRYEIGLEKGQP
mgnify:CR=1 FL=1